MAHDDGTGTTCSTAADADAYADEYADEHAYEHHKAVKAAVIADRKKQQAQLKAAGTA